jgi:hypothetical protein
MEIIKNISETEREIYGFRVLGLYFIFSKYNKEEKPKGKRKWRLLEHINGYQSKTPLPELPEEIRREAEIEAAKLVRVMTWQEYKR